MERNELDNHAEILDIVGANNYSFGPMECREQRQHAALPPGNHIKSYVISCIVLRIAANAGH
jgi:hypothetical protein